MRIKDVLRVKGAQVVTITPDTTVRRLVAVLAEERIGAVVVSRDGAAVDGIVSERDIVRALARRGAAVLSEPVTGIYKAAVHTVAPDTELEEVARMMTERRIRHAPSSRTSWRAPGPQSTSRSISFAARAKHEASRSALCFRRSPNCPTMWRSLRYWIPMPSPPRIGSIGW